MRKGFLFLVLVAGLVIGGCGGNQAPVASGGPVVDAALICPVTGEKVPDKTKADHSDYKGKRYYFCCPSCKPEFERDPEKYASNFPPKNAKGMSHGDSK